MAYKALYRNLSSQLFREVVGQMRLSNDSKRNR
jgi:hypothetical protein